MRLAGVVEDVAEDHGGALLGEAEAVGRALPAGAAGDERRPAREPRGHPWIAALSLGDTLITRELLYGMRAAIPALRRAGGGSIIDVASIYGPVGAPATSPTPPARAP